MGRRGPPRKPIGQGKLDGDKRTARRIFDGALDIPSKKPPVPSYLKGDEIEIFNKVCDLLLKNKIVTLLDENVLGRYAKTFAQWIRIRNEIDKLMEKEDYYLAAGENAEKLNPVFSLEANLSTRLLAIEKQFGLTASSRASIEYHPAAEKSASGGVPVPQVPSLDEFNGIQN